MSSTSEPEVGTFEEVIYFTLNKVNQSQYMLPCMSFFFVLYTYYSIGEGRVWKYLLYVTGANFMASILANIQDDLKNVAPKDYLLQIKWFEGIFWGLNEYGFVYISYLKLKTVVQQLQKKYWDYIMYILFGYTMIVRIFLAYLNIAGRANSAGSHLHGLTHVPLGLVEVIFMVLIIKTSIEQSKNNSSMSRGIISTMLKSSLSRMFLVALVFFLASILCFCFEPPNLRMIKNMVWRVKAILGLIFLLDLLLIRIDLRDTTNKNTTNSYNDYGKKSYSTVSNNYIGSNMDLQSQKMQSTFSYNNINMKTFNNNANNMKYIDDDEKQELNKYNMNTEPITIKMNNNQQMSYSSSFSNLSRQKASDMYYNQLM